MTILNIYIVHSEHLTPRLRYINSTIEMLKKITQEIGFKTELNLIKEPTKEQIEKDIDNYNKKVNYDKEIGEKADEQYGRTISPLNAAQISNIEKQRMVYKVISAAAKDQLHFIIEDDVLIGEDYIQNIKTLFQNLYNKSFKECWDILFTSMADITNNPLHLTDSRASYKLLVCKSSYFIQPALAARLYEYLNVYKYNLKNSIGKYIWDNKDVRSYVLNKHTLLEGSKMGLFTTSVNNSNFLYQNSNFVSLARITATNEEVGDAELKEADRLYKLLEKLEDPDVLHTMGVVYYKNKDYANAKKYMTEAAYKLQERHGYVSRSSEILNNAINIYQYDQIQLEESKKKVSKYNPN